MLNERRLLRHPFTQPLKLVVRVFRRIGFKVGYSSMGLGYVCSLPLGKRS